MTNSSTDNIFYMFTAPKAIEQLNCVYFGNCQSFGAFLPPAIIAKFYGELVANSAFKDAR